MDVEFCMKYSIYLEKSRMPQIFSELCELSVQARSRAIQFSTHPRDRAQRLQKPIVNSVGDALPCSSLK